WALLDPGPSGNRLAALLQRPLGAHGSGLVLGQRRAVGVGDLSLWPLGFASPVRLVLGATDPMGPCLGLLAPGRRKCRLGAVASISASCDRWRPYRGGRETHQSPWFCFCGGKAVSGTRPPHDRHRA